MATIDAYLMSFQYKILINTLYLNKNYFPFVLILQNLGYVMQIVILN